MGRTKGAKNKNIVDVALDDVLKKYPSPPSEIGNALFNLSTVEPSNTIGQDVAAGAILPEDLELERSLQSLTLDVPPVDDPEPIGSVVKREVERREMLGDHVDGYQPATTLEELREQVHIAKTENCDSIEATLALCQRVCRDKTLEKVGYFMYHDIKVYIVGAFERAKARDSQTIEQRKFGHSSDAERRKALKDKIKAIELELEQV